MAGIAPARAPGGAKGHFSEARIPLKNSRCHGRRSPAPHVGPTAMRQLRLVLTALVSTILGRLRRGPRLPSWTFTFELVIDLLRRDWGEMRSWDIPRIRRDIAGKPMPKAAIRKVRSTSTALGGVRCVELEPAAKKSAVVIFYLHGGTYLYGSPETHLDIGARFALSAGARVVLPAYRQAPEHPYPAALEDAHTALRALVKSGVAPERIALAGESAGGNLALALALAVREADEPPARAIVLMSPWLDLSASFPSTRSALDDYGDREMLIAQARLFAGAIPLDDPRVSPLYRSFERLPRVFLQVGGAERLHDETVDLARRMKGAGVDVTLDLLAEMPHAAQLLAEWSAPGQAAIERAAAFLTEESRRPLDRDAQEVEASDARPTTAA